MAKEVIKLSVVTFIMALILITIRAHTHDLVTSQKSIISKVSLVAQMIKNPCAMQETWVPSLGYEDPLEKGMATHSSILTWRIPWTEEPSKLQSTESQRVRQDCVTKTQYYYK